MDDGAMSPSRRKAVVEVEDPESGRRLTARLQRVGEDLVVAVEGGERPHIGCVVMAVPNAGRSTPTVSVLTIPPHKEEPIARAVAEPVCRACGGVVVVTAGVHEDGIDRDGIEIFLRLGAELGEAAAQSVARD